MKERRNYDRIKINTTGIIYIDGVDSDILVNVVDISEESVGLRFEMPPGMDTIVREQHTIKIQFVDTYQTGKSKKTDVISATALVKRINIESNTCVLGCVIYDESFRRYAIRRMMEIYYK